MSEHFHNNQSCVLPNGQLYERPNSNLLDNDEDSFFFKGLHLLITEEYKPLWAATLLCHFNMEEDSKTKTETFLIFNLMLLQTPGFPNFLGSDKVSLSQFKTSRYVDAFNSK